MTSKTWSIPIDSDGMLSFPEDLIKEMGWKDGTILSWDYDENGTIKLKAKTDDLDTTSPESSS